MMRPIVPFASVLAVLAVCSALSSPASGADRDSLSGARRWEIGWEQVVRVLTLRDYNTRIVVMGAAMLGGACGVIGTFTLLRKRALMGDALSHATAPGIGLAFIVMASMGGSGKWLPGLLIGGAASGVLGLTAALMIRRYTRIKDDAALGIVLSVFFGVGVSILGVIQKMELGHAAGLESFIYGKTASMLWSDAVLIGAASCVSILACIAWFKEFGLICFDADFARAQGQPLLLLDVLMMGIVILVTVIGLQAVGLILMIALLVIPPAAARFWTDELGSMALASAIIGAGSGFVGAALSAVIPKLPAGAVIVTSAAAAFALSLLLGRSRGVVWRWRAHLGLQRRVADQNLLRSLYELGEPKGAAWADAAIDGSRALSSAAGENAKSPALQQPRRDDVPPQALARERRPVDRQRLLKVRSWSKRALGRTIGRSLRRRWVEQIGANQIRLSDRGLREALRVVRNHRLWEIYLITHADIAPSHVDRDADQLEHVLAPAMVEKLESLLAERFPQLAIPPSPHRL